MKKIFHCTCASFVKFVKKKHFADEKKNKVYPNIINHKKPSTVIEKI